ncbi:lipopolysaccharide kinase InaA family protein [Limnoglobus roseus]|uniref:Uncharacterized protein n=1 Tax=Limnoglobus roseus TaxID=2598579 RepID=A0A5C1A753_9BACT|nr:lipopolysaccharide kinase InaA family protein [Limnoglobus roseus]QEL14550.1 hypothetical protein PX52LOC_01440 [Limnoglobus roseus]
MLVNLMPPPVETEFAPAFKLREPEIVVSQPEPDRGFLVVHPRYRHWLAKCGLTTSTAVWNLPGEIVSGHPSRHVLQVAVRSGGATRNLFLKRELIVGWRVRRRNRRDGFGPVSRSEREAKILQRLEDANLPGPHWIAYGEDGDGRAFLLVDELTGCRELRDVLGDAALSPTDRRTLAVRLGESLASLHAAGFDTPDLAAKHVFVRPGSFSPTLLDWQSSQPGRRPDADARRESLATLDATLTEWLATPRERLRALRAYQQKMDKLVLSADHSPSPRVVDGQSPSERVTPLPNPPPQGGREQNLSSLARAVRVQSQKLLAKSSVRDQRQPNALSRNQRLVWLADEAVCAIPEVAKLWPRPAVCSPYYLDPTATVEDGERLGVRLADDRAATLLRFRTTDWLGRGLAVLRGKSWRSPAANLSRLMFHLQKAGVPVPQLFAFGQRLTRFGPADSFLLHNLPAGSVTLDAWLTRSGDNPTERERLLGQLGGIVRSIHDADCILGPAREALRVLPTNKGPRVTVDPTHGAALVRQLTDRARQLDLVDLLRSFGQPLSADGCRRVLDGYAPTPAFQDRVLRMAVNRA